MTVGIVAYLAVVGACVALAAWLFEKGLRSADLPCRWSWIGAIGLLLGAIIVAPRADMVSDPAKAASISTQPLHSGIGPIGGAGERRRFHGFRDGHRTNPSPRRAGHRRHRTANGLDC